MDKRFFKNWVLHIPQCLRDLLWIVRVWSSVAPIFSSLIVSRDYSCVHSSQSLLKVITSFWHTFLEWMNPWYWDAIQGGYNNILFFFDCFVITSNTSFWCLQGWHMRYQMIFNRICNDSLGSILSLISLWLLNLSYWNTDPSQFLQGS